MPGSLLLGNDSYSDVSDVSSRSLDSKTGGKKVSFNKAVRVKQYPWKPEFDATSSEHITLPSNRFWFKVYKNKQDSSDPYDSTQLATNHNAWGEENMECIHDSLAPIAEVEDQEIEASPRNTNGAVERNGYSLKPNDVNNRTNNGMYDHSYHPIEPPVDYLEETNSAPLQHFNAVKHVWGANESNGTQYIPASNSYIYDRNQWNGFESKYPYDTIIENDETGFRPNSPLGSNARFQHYGTNNENSTRRSLRRLDNSNYSMPRERRSRSHDDYMDNEDNRFRHLRKADKSVSTEDLNGKNDRFSPTNRFYKGSRDIATQCYGTLTRNKNTTILPNLNSTSTTQTDTFTSNTERLKKFKSPPSRFDIKDDYNNNNHNNNAVSYNKDYPLEKVANLTRPRANLARTGNLSTKTEQNQKPHKYETFSQNKISNGNIKPLKRTENSISSIIQKQANKTFNKLNFRNDTNTSPSSSLFKKTEENSNQSNNKKQSNTVGYLRGRQIPLSEVNTNNNRKFLNRNNYGLDHNSNSRGTGENHLFSSQSLKADIEPTKKHQSKRYLSPTNNSERRSFRINSNSAKNYPSSYSEGGSSMIDWSLSGFQLTSKPDNGVTSISDSEYTVHRRPPLLMYIPGVSHHDRPAIEDDRLSALSDFSKSDFNDGVSSIAGGRSSNDRIGGSDFRRRQSMREEKSKWMKWRSKS